MLVSSISEAAIGGRVGMLFFGSHALWRGAEKVGLEEQVCAPRNVALGWPFLPRVESAFSG